MQVKRGGLFNETELSAVNVQDQGYLKQENR